MKKRTEAIRRERSGQWGGGITCRGEQKGACSKSEGEKAHGEKRIAAGKGGQGE